MKIGVLEYGRNGVLEYWSTGVMDKRNIGMGSRTNGVQQTGVVLMPNAQIKIYDNLLPVLI
jgi:hypothetical protein